MPGRRSFSNLRRGIEAGYVAPALSPSDMLAISSSGALWYDPTDLSTLFQDAAGTTPVTATGQFVGKMNDKSGRGMHLTWTAASGTARPIYRASGGLSWIEFSQPNFNYLVSSANVAMALNPCYDFFAWQNQDTRSGVTSTPRIMSVGSNAAGNDAQSSSAVAVFYQNTSPNRQIALRTTGNSDAVYTPKDNNKGIVEWSFNGTAQTVVSNGVTGGSTPTMATAATSTNSGKFALGIHITNQAPTTALTVANWSTLDFYGMLHLGYVPNSTQISGMRQYYQGRLGI